MDSNDKGIQQIRQGIPVMLVAQPMEEDAINILDLLRSLVRQKKLIAGFTAAGAIIGLTYALLASPIYKAELAFLPPTIQDVEALMEIDNTYTSDSLFAKVSAQLNSRSLRREFFLQHGILEKQAPEAKTEQQLRDAFNSFDKSLEFKDGTLSLMAGDASLTAQWLNEFAQFTDLKTREQIIEDATSMLRIKKTSLENELDKAMASASYQRLDWERRLKDALEIADKLGLVEYKQPTLGSSGKDGNVSIPTTESPLYMRGSKPLKAELSTLEKSSNADEFAPGVFELRQNIRYLETQLTQLTQSTKADNFKLFRIDNPAIAPEHPIKPQRKLIILGAALSGLLLGSFIALLTAAVRRSASARA